MLQQPGPNPEGVQMVWILSFPLHFFVHCLFTQHGKISPEVFKAFPNLNLFANTAALLLISTVINKGIKHWINMKPWSILLVNTLYLSQIISLWNYVAFESLILFHVCLVTVFYWQHTNDISGAMHILLNTGRKLKNKTYFLILFLLNPFLLEAMFLVSSR